MITFLLSLVGFAVGAVVGFSFGAIQNAALRKHEKRQQAGALKNAWSVMPGSMTRIAFLLIMLAVIQVLIPIVFEGGMQWLVSGGVVIGYGSTLLKHLRAVA